MRVATTLVLVWLLTFSPALAWNATGHKIIASIAFRQLSAPEQEKIVAILKRHPRFQQDFADEMPAEIKTADEPTKNEWLFQQAAIWPDTVRSGPADKRAFGRNEWHYINVPLFLTDEARREIRPNVNLAVDPPATATADTAKMNVVQVIRFARSQCSDPRANPVTRGLLLSWLFHTVGDIHQPLHSSALFSFRLFPEGDRGGNSIKTRQGSNLHSLWDGFPGRSTEFRNAHNKAIGHTETSYFSRLGTEAATTLDETVWLNESHELAKSTAYAEEIIAALQRMEAAGSTVNEIELSQQYLKAGGHVAEQRLVAAGYRLSAVLKQVLRD